MSEADALVEGRNVPNCHRCYAEITPGKASRRKEEVRQTVSGDGKRETQYSTELICNSCVNWERLVIAGKAAFFALVAVVWALKLMDPFSLEARSQETTAVMPVAPRITTKPRPILIPTEKPDGPTIFYRWINR
jgi:hypothetical protein